MAGASGPAQPLSTAAGVPRDGDLCPRCASRCQAVHEVEDQIQVDAIMTVRGTDDLRIQDVRPLIPPAILLEELPISERASNVVADARVTLTSIVHGDDSRLAVIVGPCSMHAGGGAPEDA